MNFDNPQRRGNIATYWCFAIGNFLSLLFLAQKLYVKLAFASGLELDDGKKYSPNLFPQLIYDKKLLLT